MTMPQVTYKPGVGDADVVEAFGKVFEAGKGVEVPEGRGFAADGKPLDEQSRVLAKLQGNPFFQVAGQKAEAEDKAAAENDRVLEKALDGRTKAAREAKAKADQAVAEAAEKERARAAVQVIADRRDPPEVV